MWFVCYGWICCEYTSMSLVWVVGVCCIILKFESGKKAELNLDFLWSWGLDSFSWGVIEQWGYVLPSYLARLCLPCRGRFSPAVSLLRDRGCAHWKIIYLLTVNRCPSVTWPKFPQGVNQRECTAERFSWHACLGGWKTECWLHKSHMAPSLKVPLWFQKTQGFHCFRSTEHIFLTFFQGH